VPGNTVCLSGGSTSGHLCLDILTYPKSLRTRCADSVDEIDVDHSAGAPVIGLGGDQRLRIVAGVGLLGLLGEDGREVVNTVERR